MPHVSFNSVMKSQISTNQLSNLKAFGCADLLSLSQNVSTNFAAGNTPILYATVFQPYMLTHTLYNNQLAESREGVCQDE